MKAGEQLLVTARDRAGDGEEVPVVEGGVETMREHIRHDRKKDLAGIEDMHRIESEIVGRRCGDERGQQVLVAADNMALVRKQITVMERTECAAENVVSQRKSDLAAREHVQCDETKIRRGWKGANRSKQVGVAVDHATGGGNQIPALHVVRRRLSRSRRESTDCREPAGAHGGGGTAW